MSNNAAISPVIANQVIDASSYASTEILSPQAVLQDDTVVSNPADLRLEIEEDQQAGTVVYKTVDWRTGEVVQQLPREAVLKLREDQNYTAGQLLKAKT